MNRHPTFAAAKLPIETNVYKMDKPININPLMIIVVVLLLGGGGFYLGR
jgi:hypothetical protein